MKIGILGGTFDPIHNGHLEIARQSAAVFGLEAVWLMISNRPPHKTSRPLTGAFHRYAMATLATADESSIRPCSWELERPAPTYTVEVLAHFDQLFPETTFCFIAGSDSLKDIHLWREYAKLLRENCFVFVQRPGETVDIGSLGIAEGLKDLVSAARPKDAPQLQRGRSFLIDLGAPNISSTRLRRRIASGSLPPASEVPLPVLNYIAKYRLYERNRESAGESLRCH